MMRPERSRRSVDHAAGGEELEQLHLSKNSSSSHLFVGPLRDTEQEEEEPYEANADQEAERYHGDDQGV